MAAITWRLHFGGFAPRAWRVSAGRLEKNRGFFDTAIAHSACAFGSSLIPPSDPPFPHRAGSVGRSVGFCRGLGGVFVKFALLKKRRNWLYR